MSKQINAWEAPTDTTSKVVNPKASSTNEVTRIPLGTEIRHGALISSDDIRIDGRFFGKILTKGRVVIGEKAEFVGQIVAENADIYGSFNGKIVIGEILSLMNSCNMDGDILIQKLGVEQGAKFDGNCQIISKDNFNKIASDFQSEINKEYPSIVKGKNVVSAPKADFSVASAGHNTDSKN